MNRRRPCSLLLLLLLFVVAAVPLFGQYTVDDIKLPPTVAPEIGGLGFSPNGELFVVTRRSGIIYAKPAADGGAFEWKSFTNVSLHNPMGIHFLGPRSILVPTMQSLMRVSDTDGDGEADAFENLNDGWGISGNYHETNAGPIPDGKGGYFIAVGTASHNGPTFHRVRGEYSKIGRRGRNFSAVEFKGWVLRCGLDGSVEPFASGFRANNGIGMNLAGDLFVTDNQGDWRGTSPIYHVEKGDFCGHPSSLVWDKAFYPAKGDPLNFGIPKLDAMRKRAAILLPQGDICNSPGEPVWDTSKGAFGPFEGQFFVGDIAGARILRCMLEKVDGEYQGAVIKFVDGKGLRGGNNRLVYSPDGKQLYTGQTYRGWGRSSEGLQRITFGGEVPFEIERVKLSGDSGFKVTFTQPVATENLFEAFKIRHFHYSYGHKYGSGKIDTKEVAVKSLRLENPRSVVLELPNLVEQKVYQFDLEVKSESGSGLGQKRLFYTLNRVPEK